MEESPVYSEVNPILNMNWEDRKIVLPFENKPKFINFVNENSKN